MDKKYTSIEMCAGAGGQAIGLEEAGFTHRALIENDRHACATLRLNRPLWQVFEESLESFDAHIFKGTDLVAGGVPCPPFSRAGAQLGEQDSRNLFPHALRIVREVKPRAVLFENVRGLLDRTFDEFRGALRDALLDEDLELRWKLLNASDFGVPQLRPRAVGVALRPQDWVHFHWPNANRTVLTVGDVLYEEMSKCGWNGVDEWRARANRIAPTLVGGSKKHGGADLGPTRAKQQWARLGVDALVLDKLPPPPNFVGSPRLTVEMAAILQGFPRNWHFAGGKTAAYRQVGNAFPPPVARAVSESILTAFKWADSGTELPIAAPISASGAQFHLFE